MAIGIYAIRNKLDLKVYVGQTSTSFKERFRQHRQMLRTERHDNAHLQHAWSKHGEVNFEFCLLEECGKEDLDHLESYYMDFLGSLNPTKGYNLDSVVFGSKRHSEETKAKISASNLGKVLSEETKAKLAASHRGMKASEATKAKMALARIGRKHSDETIAKMSEAKTGLTPSVETRTKLSHANTGRKLSDETLAKRQGRTVSDATRAKLAKARKGKTTSEETRAKMRESWKRRHPPS